MLQNMSGRFAAVDSSAAHGEYRVADIVVGGEGKFYDLEIVAGQEGVEGT